jgi:NADPH-dependent 2,4-dienoyl-CoA reductase/sulfur reductase-like enzyme/rhodanese-related sulfurtransferase
VTVTREQRQVGGEVGDHNRAVLIVGASAAGLRCACRLARLKPRWQVTVVDQSPVFSYAACGLPYVLSGDIEDVASLRKTAYGALRDQRYFEEEKGVDVLAGWRATSVRLAESLLRIEGADGERNLTWDELVLAQGARPRLLPKQPVHPRVRTFHRWDDVDVLKTGLARGEIRSVGVIGAGPLGCELAEAFRELWGAEVCLVEAASAPLPGFLDPEVGACVARHIEGHGVRLLTDCAVEILEGDDSGVTIRTGTDDVRVDVCVVAIGVEPDVELARQAGVRLGETGAIAVDEQLRTSVPHVWAVGDCVEVRDAMSGLGVYRPLGSLANRQGRTLANVLGGRPDRFPPVAGAVAVKAFEFNIAAVGTTEERARARGTAVRACWVTVDDRPHYWPASAKIHLKLVYEAASQRVLGVQAVGKGDVVRRVDVATQLMVRGATLAEFAQLEHAYSPAYAPAVDPLAVAAVAAQNQEDGVEAEPPLVPLVEVTDLRLPEERQERPARAVVVHEVALSGLRSSPDARIQAEGTVICERGGRSAEAVRLLRHSGQHARYLGGGLLWREAAERRKSLTRK